ncbi:glutaredoxin family protein [Glutamicibacter sp. AOP5-A2-18]|uniref:glutaredoxin family protein n=1 Tax=Glutamicibacter sp. AOP5-A2-18 TaxID=3457656 RepID=UPI0040336CEA
MRTITLYTTQNCQQCRGTKRVLDKSSVEYVTVQADAADAHELAEAIRGRADELGVPATMPYVTVYDDDNMLVADWFGFQPGKITDFVLVRDEDAA